MSRPMNTSPQEWELALSMARSICAGYFKKGGTAVDALKAYGMPFDNSSNWQIAIEAIAFAHCQKALPRAA